MSRARYSVHEYPDKGVVAIIDEFDDMDPTLTITNDAEMVINDLFGKGLLNDRQEPPHKIRVIYRDTTGTWDEIVLQDKRFLTFRHLGAKSVVDALAQVCSP